MHKCSISRPCLVTRSRHEASSLNEFNLVDDFCVQMYVCILMYAYVFVFISMWLFCAHPYIVSNNKPNLWNICRNNLNILTMVHIIMEIYKTYIKNHNVEEYWKRFICSLVSLFCSMVSFKMFHIYSWVSDLLRLANKKDMNKCIFKIKMFPKW